MLLIGMA